MYYTFMSLFLMKKWLFSQVDAKVDNLARFMSADQKVSITDANLASNGFLGTWVLLRQTTINSSKKPGNYETVEFFA